MRVNIGYSCDLEDVQEELASFLERVSLKLNDAASAVGNVATGMLAEKYDPQETLLGIHKVRVALNKLDLRLEDASTIIAGLENARAKIAAGESLEPMPEASAEAAPIPGEPPEVVAEQEEEPAEEPVRVKGPTSSSKKARKKKRGR